VGARRTPDHVTAIHPAALAARRSTVFNRFALAHPAEPVVERAA